MHAVDEVAPTTVLNVPLGHKEQASVPVVAENSPGLQDKQVPLLASYDPGRHPRLLQVDAPGTSAVEHGAQVLDPARAAYVPGSQSVQEVPSADERVPGPHGTQKVQKAGGITPHPTYPPGQRVQVVVLSIMWDAGSQ